MRYIVTALYSEAKPLIDFFNLIKHDDPYFPIFQNNQIILIVSGIGKINAAIATTYLLANRKTNPKLVLNLGICGSSYATHQIGELFEIKKIIDQSSSKVIHLTDKNLFQTATLACFDTPQNDPSKLQNRLIDMESFGFYQSSKKFLKSDAIHLIKVVSDKISDTILSPNEVYDLISVHLPTLKEKLF